MLIDPTGKVGNRQLMESDTGVGSGSGGVVLLVIALFYAYINTNDKPMETTVTTPMAPIYIVETMVKEVVKEAVIEAVKEKDIAPPKTPQDPVHHIVAQGATNLRAAPAQEVLRKAGIDRYTDPANLIQLPLQFHVRLHTTAYYNRVNSVLGAVDPYDTIAVYRALAILRAEIYANSIMGTFKWY